MTSVLFSSIKTILCVGAHSDDIEIGAGATILRLVRENPDAHIIWLVCSAHGARREEAQKCAKEFLVNAGESEVVLTTLRDGHFPAQMNELKATLEAYKPRNPDVILTHYRDDLHQDHRAVSEATWNTFRNNTILEYEIPKWDGGLGSPNFFVHATQADTDRKIDSLVSNFPSQSKKHWYDDLTFRGLMRLRGLESNAPENFAEGFYARKIRM